MEKKIIETIKKDLPNTFIYADRLTVKNTGGPLTVGHRKALSSRLNTLYNKVKNNPYTKAVFNAYWRKAIGINPNKMNKDLYPIVKDILDFKLDTDNLDMFNAQVITKEIITYNDINVPIYNNENVLYVGISDMFKIGIDVKTIIPVITHWGSHRFNDLNSLEMAVETGSSFWKYLNNLYGVKHNLQLYYKLGIGNSGYNKFKLYAYFPFLKSRSMYYKSNMYFGKQRFWFDPYKTATYNKDIFMSTNFIRGLIINTSVPVRVRESIKLFINHINNTVFEGTMWEPLKKYYDIPYPTFYGYQELRRATINKIVNFDSTIEDNTVKNSMRYEASQYISELLENQLDRLTFNQWVQKDYITAIELLKSINIEEVNKYVRDRAAEWNLGNT